MLKVSYQKIQQFVTGKDKFKSFLGACHDLHPFGSSIWVSQLSHLIDSLKTGDDLLIEAIGFAIDEMLILSFDRVKQLRII